MTRCIVSTEWTDWVDYWAVDFDYESRQEIMHRPKNFGVEVEIPGIADSTRFVEFEEHWPWRLRGRSRTLTQSQRAGLVAGFEVSISGRI